MNAFIVSIGDELLYGSTIDTNSVFIARSLQEFGIAVIKKIAVADTRKEILEGLKEASNKADLIIMTGGLGPTKDDITKKTLAEYFNSELELNQEVLDHVTQIFAKWKRPLLQVNHDQALVPACAEILFNNSGTAPGMWLEQDNKTYISLPGVPFEMKHLMEKTVLPRLRNMKHSTTLIHEYIQTVGIGESRLAEIISDIEDEIPKDIHLAYLPSIAQVKLRLTGKGNDPNLANKISKIVDAISERISKYIFAYGEISLEDAIGKKLQQSKSTLSLAESCTGGYISHKLTTIPGSSVYFMGSYVTYDYEVKEKVLNVKKETLVKYGAVSKETVEEMLSGCLANLDTTYGIAVSGIAGPGGGLPDKPVGTVFIGVGNKKNHWIKKHQFRHDRELNIKRTSVVALNMLRIFIDQEENY